jgi:hypothetical protein
MGPDPAVSLHSDMVDHADRRRRKARPASGAGSTVRKGTAMTATLVRKSEIVSILRSRGKFARADWFDRALPDLLDTASNSSLLANLEIDAGELEAADRLPGKA